MVLCVVSCCYLAVTRLVPSIKTKKPNKTLTITYSEVGWHKSRKDFGHCLFTEGVHGHNAEVAQKTRGHCVTATTRWTHSSDELNVLQNNLGGVFKVIPVTQVRLEEDCESDYDTWYLTASKRQAHDISPFSSSETIFNSLQRNDMS